MLVSCLFKLSLSASSVSRSLKYFLLLKRLLCNKIRKIYKICLYIEPIYIETLEIFVSTVCPVFFIIFYHLQYRPKLIGLVFKLLLWPKYSSYRLGIGAIRKILNWGFQNTSNLLRLLISGLRKLSLKVEGRNLINK